MALIGGSLGYHLLRLINDTGETGYLDGSAYANKSKLETLFGDDFWSLIQGKLVMDFGCRAGTEAVEMAKRGARKVIGVDILDKQLCVARERAVQHGVADRCLFTNRADERVDVIVALDSFEHFADPAAILDVMRQAVKPGGCVLASFGPTCTTRLVATFFRSSHGRISSSVRRHSCAGDRTIDPMGLLASTKSRAA